MLESNYTQAKLEKMLVEYTQKIDFFKDDMVKAKSEGNKTRYYSDLKQIKIYSAKVQWVTKLLANLPGISRKSNPFRQAMEKLLDAKRSFMNHHKEQRDQESGMRNHDGPAFEHRGRNSRGGPPPRGCHGGTFKFLVIVLVGVHFYSLHKYRQALDTIKASKMTKVDDESLSFAPVSVPITMVNQALPSNYMVV